MSFNDQENYRIYLKAAILAAIISIITVATIELTLKGVM